MQVSGVSGVCQLSRDLLHGDSEATGLALGHLLQRLPQLGNFCIRPIRNGGGGAQFQDAALISLAGAGVHNLHNLFQHLERLRLLLLPAHHLPSFFLMK